MSEQTNNRELTFGEKVVGVKFNPSGDDKVTRLKALLAEAIDIVQEDAAPRMNPADYDLFARGAIGTLLAAQMAAVKSVTLEMK